MDAAPTLHETVAAKGSLPCADQGLPLIWGRLPPNQVPVVPDTLRAGEPSPSDEPAASDL